MGGEWKTIRLGEVCRKIGSGATPRGGSSVYLENGSYALIRSQNVYNEGFRWDGLAYISDEHAAALANVEVLEEDILLNITGDSVARVCQVTSEVLPARVNQHVAIIRPDRERLDPRFLRYYLSSPEIQSLLLSWAGSGGTRNALTKGMIESLEVLAPADVSEQRAIAHILGTLDDKIELNRRMNETLEGMARALFKSWFVDFDPVRVKMEGRDPGLPQHLADLFPERLVESEVGEVPEGWEVGCVDDLCSKIENGGTPKRLEPRYWGGSVPWFKTGELTDGPLLESQEKITSDGLLESSCKLWPTGTILIALYASPTVGRLGILEVPAAANQACSALLARPEFGTLFLFYALLLTRDRLQRIAVGAAQQNISQKIVRAHRIVIPPASTAQCFDQLVKSSYQRRVGLGNESRTLSALRDALLPKLMSGEVRVVDSERFGVQVI